MADQFDDEDFDLASLPDDELIEQMHDDLYNGLRDEIVEATNILLSRGWSASRVLDEALVEGMRIVGVDFRDGILFVPEVLVGGAPLNEAFGKAVGADAYCRDAGVAVETAKALIQQRRAA